VICPAASELTECRPASLHILYHGSTIRPARAAERYEILISPERQRHLIEAIHERNADRDRLFQLIAALANLLDRDIVIETVAGLLKTQPVVDGDSVAFGDVAIRFGADNRVRSVYQIIDGSDSLSD